MRLLVTRPEPDAVDLAGRLIGFGHEPIIEPMLTIEPTAFSLPPGPFSALLLTSRHAASALAKAGAAQVLHTLPAMCVGEATAAAAYEAGFVNVDATLGNVDALARMVIARLVPSAGHLLYARGREVAGDLTGTLVRAGFTMAEVVVYAARSSECLTPETVKAISDRSVDGVVLMSPRTAATFARLVASAGLEPALAGVTAYCLSPPIAARVTGLGLRPRVATRPSLEALLNAIGIAPTPSG